MRDLEYIRLAQEQFDASKSCRHPDVMQLTRTRVPWKWVAHGAVAGFIAGALLVLAVLQ